MADKIERELGKNRVPYFLTAPFLNYFNKSSYAMPTNELQNNAVPESTTVESVPNYCSVVKKVKKENITPENIGEIILCQIPGISAVTAISIMRKFSSYPHFMEEINNNPACLENLTYEHDGKTRKISKTCIENIRRFLIKKVTPEV